MAADILEIGSDYLLTLSGATNAADGTYLNSATVSYTLRDAAGTSITTGSLSYVTASNGNYQATIQSTVTSGLTTGAAYRADIVLSQSGVDRTFRVDMVAQSPGEVVISAEAWMEGTGQTVTGADLAACRWICGAVRKALLKKLRPYVPEPQDGVTFYVDAPPREILSLPVRPVRVVTSVAVHPGAMGDSTQFTADDVLASTDYYSPADPLDGFNRAGLLYRAAGNVWGYAYRAHFGTLAAVPQSDRGAVKVVADVGEATVPDDVREAAKLCVTKLMLSRKHGTQVQSASLNGASYSLPSQAAVNGAFADPTVLNFLSSYMTPRLG